MSTEIIEEHTLPSPNTILIVDDDAINRAILRNLFEPHYEVEEAVDGEDALQAVLDNPTKYCLILLDFVMEKMDGVEFLRYMNTYKLIENIPVFLITAVDDFAVTKSAYELGVMDVIAKPIVPFVVLRRAQSIVELFQARKRLSNVVEVQQSKLLQQARQLNEMSRGLIEALAAAIEFRDGESGDHVRRIHDITKITLSETSLGQGLTEHEIDNIALASIMHDVGKIGIPDAILQKPGKLTNEEREIMKTHTTIGANLIGSIPQLQNTGTQDYATDIAKHHHERWDGKGYPDGLTGDEIPIWTQIVSLADVYDALRNTRVYKPARTREETISMIKNGECGAFNPELLEKFMTVEPLINQYYSHVQA